MKHNNKPQDIEKLDFDVITLAGKGYRPINPGATLIACKGEKDTPMKGKGFRQFLAACKAYFSEPDTFQYPVTTDVADDIDNDGDGAADYNAIATAICSVSQDIQAASCISDDDARSQSVKNTIDAFLSQLDDFMGDDAEKAGARHSAADQAHLDALKEAHAKMGEHLDALSSDGATKGEPDMTDADKAAFKAEIEAGLDAKVETAVKAATDAATKPLNEKIAEQEAAIADAVKAAEDAKTASDKLVSDAQAAKAETEQNLAAALAGKKAAEDTLADAVTKARGRKAAGGHDENAPADPKAAFQTLVKENPSAKISDAVAVLMRGTPLTPQ